MYAIINNNVRIIHVVIHINFVADKIGFIGFIGRTLKPMLIVIIKYRAFIGIASGPHFVSSRGPEIAAR